MAVAEAIPVELPAAPSLGRSLRSGASDFYYNSWRVVPVNLVLGLGLVGVALAWVQLGAVVAALLASLLAWPIAGLFRLGARATRGVGVSLGDALDPVRAIPIMARAARRSRLRSESGASVATTIMIDPSPSSRDMSFRNA